MTSRAGAANSSVTTASAVVGTASACGSRLVAPRGQSGEGRQQSGAVVPLIRIVCRVGPGSMQPLWGGGQVTPHRRDQVIARLANWGGNVEQPGDQRGGPLRRPPLGFGPAMHRRAFVQLSAQPGQLRRRQAAHRPARAPGRQRRGAARPPAPPPLTRRLRAHPQLARHLHRVHILLEHRCGRQPHLLPPHPARSGQATTIGISHTSRRSPPAPRRCPTPAPTCAAPPPPPPPRPPAPAADAPPPKESLTHPGPPPPPI